MSTVAEKIGDRLRQIRLSLDFTQAKMAAKLDIADRTYKFYEMGKNEIPIRTALKVCELFSVEPNWLCFGEESKKTIHELDRIGKAIEAYLNALDGIVLVKGKAIDNAVFSKQTQYLIKQVISNDANIDEEAKLLATITKPAKDD